MQEENEPLQIALEYFKAWTANDFNKASEYLSDEITFEMPMNVFAG